MVSMSVFGVLMISIMLSVGNMGIARVKSENRIALLEQLYFFSEDLVTQIKEWGILDYEEYWNRTSYNTEIGTGHYIYPSGLGNYGSWGNLSSNYGEGYYYCRSVSPTRMGSWWCLTVLNTNNPATSNGWWSYSGKYQRYGQYEIQFTDYNMNLSLDWGIPGDENSDNDIRWDDDDKDIGNGPYAFTGSMPELYLINHAEKTRVLFRWILRPDPYAPSSVTCELTGPNMGSWCLGNIQILKLRWYDIGLSHTSVTTNNSWAFDGKIDTWTCFPDWNCQWYDLGGAYGKLATGKSEEWIDLFPNFINVKSLRFSAYPQKNSALAWAAPDTGISPFIHPYVRLNMTLGFWWKKRKTIKNDDPTISINTSISLWTLIE